jgi:hypothetical protein
VQGVINATMGCQELVYVFNSRMARKVRQPNAIALTVSAVPMENVHASLVGQRAALVRRARVARVVSTRRVLENVKVRSLSSRRLSGSQPYVAVCQLGCSECASNTGTCIACKSGYTQDPNDSTKCNPVQATTSTGTVCPDGSFSSGAQCSLCSPSCKTCTGPSSNDCAVCATGTYIFNNSCVSADSNGICDGANGMIADNNKEECDSKSFLMCNT